MYSVRKTYGHERGLSCAFRQWRAVSHCRHLHGYALSFSFEIVAEKLNENNWVFDFGALKPLREALERQFDHTTIVASDDPFYEEFLELEAKGVIDLRVMRRVGCEAFAREAFFLASAVILSHPDVEERGVRVRSCTVAEHAGNSATFERAE